MAAYLLSFAVLLISLLLAVFAGPALHLQGPPLLLSRLVPAFLGVAAAAAILWLHFRGKRQAAANPSGAAENGNLDALLREASSRLASAHRKGARSLDTGPLLYLLGSANSAKTTILLKSGLEPELLAGQVYRDKDVAPTPIANLWYTRQCVVVEAGAALRQDPGLWDRLVKRTRPRAYRAAFGKGAPIRAAVVCISCETFQGAAATEASLVSARATGRQLQALARQLGTDIPVYVIVTKLDRVPNFPEFVRNLSDEEAAQALGSSLDGVAGAGVYAEQTTQAIGQALDRLAFSLGEFRLDLLPRENDPARAAALYEFPRELRKLRNNLTAYLVELVRPSHLNANPYLRGFYFTGVRAQIVEQVVSASAAQRTAPMDAGATRMFSLQELRTAPVSATPSTVAQKVAQWTFLPRIFPDVVLGDHGALSETGKGGRGSLFRRAFFCATAAVLALYLALLTISFKNNSVLERRIAQAAQSLPATAAPSGALASASDLRMLDELRLRLLQLETYRQDGAPWMYRWGLYHGDQLLSATRALYFDRFQRLLLTNTQAAIVKDLEALPAAPGANDNYNATYAPLRAYLITTTHSEKSTAESLVPVLMQYWQSGRTLDSQRQGQLARRQFDFYADDLRRAGNPYPIAPAMSAVVHARTYLANFGGFERIYQTMIAAANKAAPGVNFNQQYPRSAETVVDTYLVPGAFTRPGYRFMQDAIQHPDRYFSGEAWVLGDQATSSLDRTSLTQQLTTRYAADYLSEWRDFLHAAYVVHYRNLQDAASKLGAIDGNDSPLLALIYTVSHNTAVDSLKIAGPFQPAQTLVPPNSVDRFISPANTPYITGLLGVQGSVAQVALSPAGAADPAAATPIIAAAIGAHTAARLTAQAFQIDPQGHVDRVVLALMEDPITSTEALVRGLGPAQANAAGRNFCAAFNQLFAKFPFAPNSATQASPAEVSALLLPNTGSLWQFYNANLKTLLIPEGRQYVVAPNPPMQVNDAFTHFFNRAAVLSAGFFPRDSTAPSLNFTLHQISSRGIENATLTIDGQQLTGAGGIKQFSWTAQTAQQAQLTANLGGSTVTLHQFSGIWSIFQLFNKAHAQAGGNATLLDFPFQNANTPVTLPDGTPLIVQFELSGTGAGILSPGAFNGMRCVSEVAR